MFILKAKQLLTINILRCAHKLKLEMKYTIGYGNWWHPVFSLSYIKQFRPPLTVENFKKMLQICFTYFNVLLYHSLEYVKKHSCLGITLDSTYSYCIYSYLRMLQNHVYHFIKEHLQYFYITTSMGSDSTLHKHNSLIIYYIIVDL